MASESSTGATALIQVKDVDKSRLEVFDDIGHFLHIEQPRLIADLVLEFLEPHR